MQDFPLIGKPGVVGGMNLSLQGLRGLSGPQGTLWDKVPPADDSLELPQIHTVWGGGLHSGAVSLRD